MSKKDWENLGKIAAIGATIVTVHGVTNKKWTTAHTVLALLGLAAFLNGGGTAGLAAL